MHQTYKTPQISRFMTADIILLTGPQTNIGLSLI